MPYGEKMHYIQYKFKSESTSLGKYHEMPFYELYLFLQLIQIVLDVWP